MRNQYFGPEKNTMICKIHLHLRNLLIICGTQSQMQNLQQFAVFAHCGFRDRSVMLTNLTYHYLLVSSARFL